MPSPRQSRNQFIDKGIFGIFAGLGAAAILLLKQTGVAQIIVTLVPVAIILIYALITATRWTRFRLRYDQAGDNCYYLGFIYTLVSLAAALYRFTHGSEAAVDQIVQDFGIALATTLVGVTLRVLLHQMREDPHDVEEAARSELGAAAARVTGQLGSMVRDVVSFRVQTQDELKHFSYEVKQVAEEHREAIKSFRKQSEALGAQVQKLINRVETIAVPADILERKLTPTAEKLQSIAGSVASMVAQDELRVKDIGNLLDSAKLAAQQLQQAAESLHSLAAIPERVASALDQLNASTAAMAELQKGAVELAKQIGESTSRLDRLRDADAVISRIEQLQSSLEPKRRFNPFR